MSNSISGIDNMGYTFEMSPEQIIAVMTGATVRPENYQVVAYPKAVEAYISPYFESSIANTHDSQAIWSPNHILSSLGEVDQGCN